VRSSHRLSFTCGLRRRLNTENATNATQVVRGVKFSDVDAERIKEAGATPAACEGWRRLTRGAWNLLTSPWDLPVSASNPHAPTDGQTLSLIHPNPPPSFHTEARRRLSTHAVCTSLTSLNSPPQYNNSLAHYRSLEELDGHGRCLERPNSATP
jgi:hypothetical protein